MRWGARSGGVAEKGRTRMACTALGTLVALTIAVATAQGQELVIVTSYPATFFEPFKAAFAAEHPDITLNVIQRSTTSGVRFLIERPEVEADLFWASAPDAFEVLKANGQLAATGEQTPQETPLAAGYPINDPDGFYVGFALSTYGAAYNQDYLAERAIAVPQNWIDLTDPVYAGHLGISSPSRSGTTHLMIEMVLQTYGWDRGWALLSQLGGNLSTVTARSFGVLDGVGGKRFGIGLTIDFLALDQGEAPGGIDFQVLQPSMVVPASVAVLERSGEPALAQQFVAFLLSRQGQELLLDSAINRIPVDLELRALALARRSIDLSDGGMLNGTVFDAALSARRYELINVLFDEYVVRNRSNLARVWRLLGEAAALPVRPGAAAARLEQARALLLRPPLAEAESRDAAMLAAVQDVRVGSSIAGADTAAMALVRQQIRRNIESATAILQDMIADSQAGAR